MTIVCSFASCCVRVQISFTNEELEGNHLFFYDVPARAAYMKAVIAKLPSEFLPE